MRIISMTSSVQLPYELVEDVLSYVFEGKRRGVWGDNLSRTILLSVSLVGRVWYDVAVPLLYGHIYLTSSKALETLSITLSRNRRLCEQVRSVLFNDSFRRPIVGPLSFSGWWNLHRIHRACSNLHWETVKRRGTRSLPIRVFRRSYVPSHHPLTMGTVNIQTLTRLEVGHISCWPRMVMSEPLVLPNLLELVLKAFPLGNSLPTVGLTWPIMPQLIRLSLLNCSFGAGPEPPQVMQAPPVLPPGSPHLRILEIIGGLGSIEIWNMLRRSAGMLVSLIITPLYHHFRRSDLDMRVFTCVRQLCLSSQYFWTLWQGFRPPPNLQELIFKSVEGRTVADIGGVLTCIEQLLEERAYNEHANRLTSIKVLHPTVPEYRCRINHVLELATNVSVHVELIDNGVHFNFSYIGDGRAHVYLT